MIYFTAAEVAVMTRAEKPQKAEKKPKLVSGTSTQKYSYSFSFNNCIDSTRNGCGGAAVSMGDCGSLDPGSTPGRGLLPLSFLYERKESGKLLERKETIFQEIKNSSGLLHKYH